MAFLMHERIKQQKVTITVVVRLARYYSNYLPVISNFMFVNWLMSISNELSFSSGIVMKPYISSLQTCKGTPTNHKIK